MNPSRTPSQHSFRQNGLYNSNRATPAVGTPVQGSQSKSVRQSKLTNFFATKPRPLPNRPAPAAGGSLQPIPGQKAAWESGTTDENGHPNFKTEDSPFIAPVTPAGNHNSTGNPQKDSIPASLHQFEAPESSSSSGGNPFTRPRYQTLNQSPAHQALNQPPTLPSPKSEYTQQNSRKRPSTNYLNHSNRRSENQEDEEDTLIPRKRLQRSTSQRLVSPEISDEDSDARFEDDEILELVEREMSIRDSALSQASSISSIPSFACSKGDIQLALHATTQTPCKPPVKSSLQRSQLARARASLMITEDDKRAERQKKFDQQNERKYRFLVDIRDASKLRPGEDGYDPSTLHIPQNLWHQFTPFEKQFWTIKKDHYDTVVFFKKGKFFELYERDADLGHQLFDLKMTGRSAMRMVGVPESSFTLWAGKFMAEGYKVAKVEQKETAIGKSMRERDLGGKKDKVIERELDSVLTQGTAIDPDFIPSDLSNYCMAVREEQGVNGPIFGIALVDASVARFSICEIEENDNRSRFQTLLVQTRPREIVYHRQYLTPDTRAVLRRVVPNAQWSQIQESDFPEPGSFLSDLRKSTYFKKDEFPTILNKFWKDGNDLALTTLGGLISYLRKNRIEKSLLNANWFEEYDPLKTTSCLILDGQTLQNLDVLRNGPESKGTLSHLLNHCHTPFGMRLFEEWLSHPLKRRTDIMERLDAVETLVNDVPLQGRMSDMLKSLPDMGRIMARVIAGTCRVKDFQALLVGFERARQFLISISEEYKVFEAKRLQILIKSFPDIGGQIAFFRESYNFEVSSNGREASVFPMRGVELDYDEVLDRLDAMENDFTSHLNEQKRALRCTTLSYKSLGKEPYQIEVPSHISVPRNWQLKSSTGRAKRYHSPWIVSKVQELAELEELKAQMEGSSKARMFSRFCESQDDFERAVDAISELDCLVTLSMDSLNLSSVGPVCRPTFVDSEQPRLTLRTLRHPLLSSVGGAVIPNDICLGPEGHPFAIVTGPNMGGKSTLLRQVCIAVIMAQIGCFVPAASCEMTVVDRIFTRIGAHDNILSGLSTFMVELSETSVILEQATKHSLVILDELGRGTSTFDGYAIAYSVVQYLSSETKCLGLFSTHYAGLTKEYEKAPRVGMYFMDSRLDEVTKNVTFLYKFREGVCPKSFGMNVALMAGLPAHVVRKAYEAAEAFKTTTASDITPTSSRVMKASVFDRIWQLSRSNVTPQQRGDVLETLRILSAMYS